MNKFSKITKEVKYEDEELSLLEPRNSKFQNFIILLKQPFIKFFEREIDLEDSGNKKVTIDELRLREAEAELELELESQAEVIKKESLEEINQKRTKLHSQIKTLFKTLKLDKETSIASVIKELELIFDSPEHQKYISHTHLDNVMRELEQHISIKLLAQDEVNNLLSFVELILTEKMLKEIEPLELIRTYFVLRFFNEDENSQEIINKLDSQNFDKKSVNLERVAKMFYNFQFLDKNQVPDDFFKDILQIMNQNKLGLLDIKSVNMILYGLFGFKENENARIIIEVFFTFLEKNILPKLWESFEQNEINLLKNNDLRISIRSMRQNYAFFKRKLPKELGSLFLECSNVRNNQKEQNRSEREIYKKIENYFRNYKNLNFKWGVHWKGFETDILMSEDSWRMNLEIDGIHHEQERNKIHDIRRDTIFFDDFKIKVIRFKLKENENFEKMMDRFDIFMKDTLTPMIKEEQRKIWEEKKQKRDEALLEKKRKSIKSKATE